MNRERPLEVEEWRDPPRSGLARLTRRAARLRQALAERLAAPRPALAPGHGPRFAVSRFEAPFEELESIVWDPRVMHATERPPRAPLRDATLPPPERPAGADAFAWPERRQRVLLFDVFPFGAELDLLEIRLHELDAVVDMFVVVESDRSFGGLRKPLFFDRNRDRFAAFSDKIAHVVLDGAPIAAPYRGDQRRATDGVGESVFREAMFRRVLDVVAGHPEALVLWSDCDEIPSRNVLSWLKSVEFPGSLRLRSRTFRYSFGWLDSETLGDAPLVRAADLRSSLAARHLGRGMPGQPLWTAGAHLTSFLDPLALIAKFAMTSDWDPGILPFVRNHHDETERMIRSGRWFSRRLTGYDAASDPLRLIPAIASANRDRYAGFF